MKKALVIGGCIGLACVAVIVAVVLTLGNGRADGEPVNGGRVEDGQNRQVNDRQDSPTGNEQPVYLRVDENSTGMHPVSFREEAVEVFGFDEEGAIQHVKDTITSASESLRYARENGPTGRVRVMLAAIEDAKKRNDLNGTFKPLGDSFNPLGEENYDWSYYDAASSLGHFLFCEPDLDRDQLDKKKLRTSECFKHFVAQGVYNWDVESLDEIEVQGLGACFDDSEHGEISVGFAVSMTYEGNRYVALLGNIQVMDNMDCIYNVLDIVEENMLVFIRDDGSEVVFPQEVINYTTDEADEASLIQLVKDTIFYANLQLQNARGYGNRTNSILSAIEDANVLLDVDLDSTFEPVDASYHPLGDDCRDWTYMDAAGALGGLLFHEEDLEEAELRKSNLFKYLVTMVYWFDVDSVDNFEVEYQTQVLFPEVGQNGIDVIFTVRMNYWGTVWVALIGNIDGKYRVLDIVDEESLSKVIGEVENKPNGRPGKDQPENEDPLSVFPGYEGEKDGYKFCPGVGYVPISNEPGGLKNPDSDSIMPEYEPCVYDENGNCTIHVHKGYVDINK